MSKDENASRALIVVRLAKVVELVLADIGLTMNQFRLLSLLEESAPSARELSVRLVMKPPNITTMIDGMAQRGLLTRSRHLDDGRRIEVQLTAAGVRALDRARRRAEAALERVAMDAGAMVSGLFAGLDAWLPALELAALNLREAVTPSKEQGSTARRRGAADRGRPTRRAAARSGRERSSSV